MATATTRATIYLDPRMHKALRLKAVETHTSISAIVSEAVRQALREDEQDLAAIADRVGEKTISYEQLLADLKADGRI